jgi:hypothetical protein
MRRTTAWSMPRSSPNTSRINKSRIMRWVRLKAVFRNRCETARGPENSLFIRRGPGPNKFTRKYLSNFFKCIH